MITSTFIDPRYGLFGGFEFLCENGTDFEYPSYKLHNPTDINYALTTRIGDIAKGRHFFDVSGNNGSVYCAEISTDWLMISVLTLRP